MTEGNKADSQGRSDQADIREAVGRGPMRATIGSTGVRVDEVVAAWIARPAIEFVRHVACCSAPVTAGAAPASNSPRNGSMRCAGLVVRAGKFGGTAFCTLGSSLRPLH